MAGSDLGARAQLKGIRNTSEQVTLEQPLLGLIQACETYCVVGCCGIDAFDFSPIHMASHLLHENGEVRDDHVARIRAQLNQLKEEHASSGALIRQLNANFLSAELEEFCETVLKNFDTAVELVKRPGQQ